MACPPMVSWCWVTAVVSGGIGMSLEGSSLVSVTARRSCWAKAARGRAKVRATSVKAEAAMAITGRLRGQDTVGFSQRIDLLSNEVEGQRACLERAPVYRGSGGDRQRAVKAG